MTRQGARNHSTPDAAPKMKAQKKVLIAPTAGNHSLPAPGKRFAIQGEARKNGVDRKVRARSGLRRARHPENVKRIERLIGRENEREPVGGGRQRIAVGRIIRHAPPERRRLSH